MSENSNHPLNILSASEISDAVSVLKKFNKDLKIFIFDERKKLAKLVGTKFNLLVTDELNQKFIQKNKIQNALVCYPKDISKISEIINRI